MKDRCKSDAMAITLLILLFAVVVALCSCSSAAPVAAGSLTALAALTQMLNDGVVTIEQFTALKAALSASDGNWWTALAGGGLAAGMAYFQAKRSAVKTVMKLRGPTEQERRAAMTAR